MVDAFRWVSDRRLDVPIPFFSVKAIINYFTERRTCVYAAVSDFRKAFDIVNHFKLYTTLINSDVPLIVISVLVTWYCKLFVMAALCNRAGHYIFALWFLSFFLLLSFFSSPNLSGCRLDVYHTSTRGVALVRI